MKPELIVMLTHHDETVKNALELFEECKDLPVKHWGFKDVGLPPDQMKQLSAVTDKAQVIDHLNKAFAHVTSQLAAIDNATLTGKRNFLRQDRSAAGIALTIGGDLHEHLGQMIAYARMNQIVPPWSK